MLWVSVKWLQKFLRSLKHCYLKCAMLWTACCRSISYNAVNQTIRVTNNIFQSYNLQSALNGILDETVLQLRWLFARQCTIQKYIHTTHVLGHFGCSSRKVSRVSIHPRPGKKSVRYNSSVNIHRHILSNLSFLTSVNIHTDTLCQISHSWHLWKFVDHLWRGWVIGTHPFILNTSQPTYLYPAPPLIMCTKSHLLHLHR